MPKWVINFNTDTVEAAAGVKDMIGQAPLLDVGHWTLDVGCCVDVGCWMLVDVGCWWKLDVGGSWMLVEVGCWWMLNVGGCWMLVDVG
jgi:hypothetical protein